MLLSRFEAATDGLRENMVDQAEALRQLASHVGTCRDTRQKGRVVVVIGAQRGVGATTTSVNLSIALTNREASVALIDADFDQPQAEDAGIEIEIFLWVACNSGDVMNTGNLFGHDGCSFR